MKKIMFIFALLMSVGVFANASDGKVVSGKIKKSKISSKTSKFIYYTNVTVSHQCPNGGPLIVQSYGFMSGTDAMEFRKAHAGGAGLSFTCP